MIIEAKRINTTLSARQVKQLFRYFGTSEVKTAISTNGGDYWFFTDTKRQNVIDDEPYLTLKMSKLDSHDIQQLFEYRKEKMIASSTVTIVAESAFSALWGKPMVRLAVKTVSGIILGLLVAAVDGGYIPAPTWLKGCAILALLGFVAWANNYNNNDETERRSSRRR